MLKYNIKKAYKGLNCKRCCQMLNMAEKWLMPSESHSWLCTNCGNDWKAFCTTDADNNMIIKIMQHNFETKFKTFILVNNRYFKEIQKVQ